VTVTSTSRSFVSGGLEDITDTILSLAALAKAKGEVGSAFPSWDPNPTSRVLSNVTAVYRRLFSSEPRVSAVHAGLECGVIGAKVPELDALSFGPSIVGAHTIQEAVNIASVTKFYGLLVAVLDDLSAKTSG
jgi:dipeptidase D